MGGTGCNSYEISWTMEDFIKRGDVYRDNGTDVNCRGRRTGRKKTAEGIYDNVCLFWLSRGLTLENILISNFEDNFKSLFILLLSTYLREVREGVCYGTCVEVGGKLARVSSFLPAQVLGMELTSSGLCDFQILPQ